MSDTFQITVRNNSGARRAYFLLVELTLGDGVKVYQNVYLAASPVPERTGTANFFINKQWFAVTGTVPGKPLGNGIRVCTSDYEIANLCPIDPSTKKGSAVCMTAGEDGRGAEFNRQLLSLKAEVPGGFSIDVDNSFSLGNGLHQFIGLGAVDPFDQSSVVPVATFEAQPGTKIDIVPKYKYWISWGNVFSGEIIDMSRMPEPAKVDFSDRAASRCKVEHKSDGTWITNYM